VASFDRQVPAFLINALSPFSDNLFNLNIGQNFFSRNAHVFQQRTGTTKFSTHVELRKIVLVQVFILNRALHSLNLTS
jgi:hypothetical protein